MLSYEKQSGRSFEVIPDYAVELDNILSRSLSPETIDSYADEALEDMIALVQRATADYTYRPTVQHVSGKESEEAAFHYFHLSNIEKILDHVADIADGLHEIDDVIARAAHTDNVILPPQPTQAPVVGEGGTFEKVKRRIPRVKTLLFVLEKDFGIDLRDPDQLKIADGVLRNNMMREESYYSVIIPGLNRLAYVNDEEDNATYVFDTARAQELNLTPDDLRGLTKENLTELIERRPGIGRRIVYSAQFVANIRDSLTSLEEGVADQETFSEDQQNRYLIPPAPEGYQSAKSIARQLGKEREVVVAIIQELSDELGKVQRYRFGSSAVTDGYSPEQASRIIDYVTETGRLKAESAPAGTLSIQGIADELGLSHFLINQTIKQLGDQLGEVKQYRFGGAKTTIGFSPDQQRTIRELLESQGKLGVEKYPEGYRSVGGFSRELRVSPATLERALRELGDQLGEVEKYKFSGTISLGLSPDQQRQVTEHLTGAWHTQASPEGYRSAAGIAKDLGVVSQKTVEKVIGELGAHLGEVVEYRFQTRLTAGYSPEQQALIRTHLDQQGVLEAETAPEGYLSAGRFRKELAVDHATIIRVIDMLGARLGDVAKYRFGNRFVPGYSPDQQALIREHLPHRPPVAPQGYLSEYGISKKLQCSRDAVNAAIRRAGGELGEVHEYRFKTTAALGYSPEQQKVIQRYVGTSGA